MATVPYIYLNNTGTIVPDTSTILGNTQTEYQAVFGADLVVTPDTPQGVLITAETLSRTEVVDNNAQLANQINPNVAGGTFLDAIGFLTGIQRQAQSQTLVTNVTLAGIPGTIVPAGSQAKTDAGDIFVSANAVTLNGSGVAMVNFYSQSAGAIPCAVNALVNVVSSVLGWETVVNNPSSTPASTTTLGSTTQSDQQFRAYRQNTLAFQGVSLALAITSAISAVTGVTSLTFRENYTKHDATIDGIFLLANSVYACVAGGVSTDIAAALLENKSSGCAWNGSVVVNLIEPASGQTYAVAFDRPAQIPVLIRVTTTNGNAANITQAVLDYAAGNINGLTGFVVGADVSPFEISGAIMSENPGYFISKVEVAPVSTGIYSTNTLPIALNKQASTELSLISVVIA